MESPNLTYIKSISGEDKVFEQKLISIIKKEFSLEKQVYLDNIAIKNYKLTADIVHKLKHKISILGLENSHEIAIDFENNLINGNAKLKDEFETILIAITKYLQKL